MCQRRFQIRQWNRSTFNNAIGIGTVTFYPAVSSFWCYWLISTLSKKLITILLKIGFSFEILTHPSASLWFFLKMFHPLTWYSNISTTDSCLCSAKVVDFLAYKTLKKFPSQWTLKMIVQITHTMHKEMRILNGSVVDREF